MKIAILTFAAAALLLARDGQDKDKKAQQQKAKPAPVAATAVTIPQGAVEVEPNLYRFTDAQGKTWMYRRMPFGISKYEDKPAAEPVVADTNPMTATDLGDTVKFERKTPFGVSKWVKKKTELTEDEKAALAQAAAKTEKH